VKVTPENYPMLVTFTDVSDLQGQSHTHSYTKRDNEDRRRLEAQEHEEPGCSNNDINERRYAGRPKRTVESGGQDADDAAFTPAIARLARTLPMMLSRRSATRNTSIATAPGPCARRNSFDRVCPLALFGIG
jgi:hypothetical protein